MHRVVYILELNKVNRKIFYRKHLIYIDILETQKKNTFLGVEKSCLSK